MLMIYNFFLPIFTIGIFTNLFYYLPRSNILPIPEYLIHFSLFILMFFVYIYKNLAFSINRIFIFWYLLYFSINLIYLSITGIGPREFQYIIPIIMILPIFIAYSLLYGFDDNLLTKTRKSIVIAIIIAVPLLVYDFLFPGFFVDTKLLDGRAVATYANANIAGAALTLCLILTLDIIPKHLKLLYIFYIFIGVLVTFSRSNIMLFTLILFVLTIQKKLPKKLFIIIISTSIFLFIFFLSGGNKILEQSFGIVLNDNIINRLLFFIDNENSNLKNISERQIVLKAALNMFFDHPVFGNGFAATRIWQYPVGPHNTIALTLAEFGILSIFMVPLLLIVSTYDIFKYGKKINKNLAITFIIYYLYSSMFSHNMLEQAFNYVGIVILLMLGNKDKKDLYVSKN